MPDHINTVVPKFAAPWIHIAKRGSDTRHGQSWHWQGLTEWIETKDLKLDDLVATCRLSPDGLTCGGVAGVGTGVAADNRAWWSVLHLAPEQQIHCATAKPANLTDKNGAAAAISVYLKSMPGEPPQEEEPVPSPELEELKQQLADALGMVAIVERLNASLAEQDRQSQEVIAGLRNEVALRDESLIKLYERVDVADAALDTTHDNIRAFRDAQQKLFAGVE